MKIAPLIRRLVLRPLRADPARTALTLLSIALGVAVVVAIELAGDAAAGSFESSMKTLTGRVDYEITANGGIDETALGKLAGLPLNARFSPVIEQPVVIPDHGSTVLFGLDFISNVTASADPGPDVDPNEAVVISDDLASRLRAAKGDHLVLRGRDASRVFTVRSIVTGQNTIWAAIDIGAAQRLLNMPGKLDRIEVVLGPGESPDDVSRIVRSSIPESWEISAPGARSEENQRMLGAFRWNLRILSYISLLVGAFLIYNTISVSVVRRRTEIGILRAVGVSSSGVLAIFLGEAAMFGLVGSAIGLGLGRLLAGGIVGMLSDTVNALFVTSTPGALAITPSAALSGLFGGMLVSIAAALIPAREAAGTAPAEAMRRAATEHRTRIHSRRDLAISAACALIAMVLCRLGPINGKPVAGYMATLFAVSAMALATPGVVLGIIAALRGVLKRILGPEGLVAGRSLTAALSRTSVVVAALATAIAMMVAVAVMVGSFRDTVQVWLDNQLRADLYLRAQGPSTAGVYPPLASEVPDLVATVPGVVQVDILHALEIRYNGRRTMFGGAKTDILRSQRTFRFLAGDSDSILRSLPANDRAIVTEAFAEKNGVREGDTLKLRLGDRTASLVIAGINYDYSSDRGVILVDRSTLLRYLPNQPPTNVAVYLKPGADADSVRREIESRLAPYPVMLAPNRVLRDGAVKVFDRTFAITWALEAVAIFVAVLGAANSLLALVLDRRREIGVLRSLGAATGQLKRMILAEAGLLGLLAALLGLALGMSLSLVLIYVINKQSFGWTIQFHPPLALLAGAILLVEACTILAGIWPARFAARLQPAEVIHEE